jgi:hypothetical protein
MRGFKVFIASPSDVRDERDSAPVDPEFKSTASSLSDQDRLEFRSLLDRATPEALRAFAVAYNEKRLEGDGGIQTRDLIAALLGSVADDRLQRVIEGIRKRAPEALPPAIEDPMEDPAFLQRERPWLSPCVTEFVHRSNQTLARDKDLSAVDEFVDLAKHGHGESVAQMRNHGITAEVIDRILEEEESRAARS